MEKKKYVSAFFSGDRRSSNVKKNILGSLVVRGISILASFFLVPITIGYVSSELYGVWLTLSSIMAWMQFLDIGFTQGMKNKVTEAIALNQWDNAKSLVSTTYFLMIIIFIPICIALEFIIPYIDWTCLLNVSATYNPEIIRTVQILIVFFCISMVLNVLSSVVAAFQQVALSNSFNALGQLLALLGILFCVHFIKPSLPVLVFAISAMPVLITFFASIILFSSRYKRVRPDFSYIELSRVKELFSLGYKFFIINIQVVVLFQSTNFLISYVSSPYQVTSYNIAYKFLNLAMMGYTIIVGPLWPAYADAYARRDFSWMRNMKAKMNKILLLSILGCVAMALIAPWMYKIWIGDKVQVALTMTWIVAVYVSVYCWMTLNGTLLVGMSKITLETIVVVIGMCIHIPLSLVLGRFIGVYGVITSMILINLGYAIIFAIQSHKLLLNKAYGIWNV